MRDSADIRLAIEMNAPIAPITKLMIIGSKMVITARCIGTSWPL